MKYLITAAILIPTALPGTLAIAHGSGMMRHGMAGCMQMMQGMNGGGAQLPNEQWRRGQVEPRDAKPVPDSQGRSSTE
jgi:hypothetical protein